MSSLQQLERALSEHSLDLETFLRLATEQLKQIDPTSGFTESEQALLSAGGVTLDTVTGDEVLAMRTASAVAQAQQLRDSLTTAEVALRCGVSEGRVRNWAAAKAVVTFRSGRELRYPLFQFRGAARMPHTAEVIAGAPDFWSPVELIGYLTTTQRGLTVADVPVTPVEWLFSGRDVQPVLEEMDWGW